MPGIVLSSFRNIVNKPRLDMATDRVDEESARIVNCMNNCWPEYSFTYNDLRKPTGEKFRDVLVKFLKGILGVNYQLSSVCPATVVHYQYGYI